MVELENFTSSLLFLVFPVLVGQTQSVSDMQEHYGMQHILLPLAILLVICIDSQLCEELEANGKTSMIA